ncbi:MAG: CsbD family protein, partial [Gammaproteobacteria bacterium]
MNWDQVKGNWKQVKGKAQQVWGDLTDDELDIIEGK